MFGSTSGEVQACFKQKQFLLHTINSSSSWNTRSCTDTMYVLSALHESKKGKWVVSYAELNFAILTNLLWFVFEYLCGKNIKTKCVLSTPWREGLLAFPAMLEMPTYAWLLSPHTYRRNSSISRRSFLGPAASPLISISQETEILLLSGISN